MELEEAGSQIFQFLGPLLLVEGPVGLGLLTIAGFRNSRSLNPEPLTPLILLIIMSFLGLLAGIWFCYKEYSWFGTKNLKIILAIEVSLFLFGIELFRFFRG
jgi:hypothetical protein